jgi:hypothetical protein
MIVRIYDPIRCKQVASTPEERVRQALLRQMLDFLSFPKGLISVEKKVAPGLRRTDILAFMKTQEGLFPLLLIECKASAIEEEAAFRQAAGYRASLLAPFWCVAHASGIRTFWTEGSEVRSVPFLPPYPQLVSNFK